MSVSVCEVKNAPGTGTSGGTRRDRRPREREPGLKGGESEGRRESEEEREAEGGRKVGFLAEGSWLGAGGPWGGRENGSVGPTYRARRS
jgi:hypothetical protein